MGGIFNLVEIPTIDIKGEGCSTCKLLEKTSEIVKDAKIWYQNIWVVFDKDDNEDFDQAIQEGIKKGYKIAWNNQCFEYWIYLHFHYSTSSLHRNQWMEKLDSLYKNNGLGERYEKNNPNIYYLLNSIDGVNTAIKNAKRRMSDFGINIKRPSEYDPGTTMHILVEELKRYLDE